MGQLFIFDEEKQQTLNIWDWTTESDKPIINFKIQGEPQKCIKANPEDPFELLTNGDMSVNFFTWEKDGNITQHVPRLSSKDFKHTPSGFMCSSFIPTTNQSVTTTADGDVVVWTDRSLNNLSIPLEKGKKAAVKFMKLHTGSINFLTTLNKKYIISGGEDGHVKIFDLQFRLILWFERLRSGPISSISFSSQSWADNDGVDTVIDGYDIPEFIVCTKQSKIILLSKSSTNVSIRGEGRSPSPRAMVTQENGDNGHSVTAGPYVQTIVAAQYDKVYGLCSHPSKPQFAVAGHSGVVQLWDFSKKQLVASRKFEESKDLPPPGAEVSSSSALSGSSFPQFIAGLASSDQQAHTQQTQEREKKAKKPSKEQPSDVLKIQSISFSNDGALLAAGFANGTVRLLNVPTLADHDGPRNPQGLKLANYWNVSKHAVVMSSFSPCGNYLAFADAGFAVTLFRKEFKVGPKKDIQGQGPAVERLSAGTLSVQWVLIGRCQSHHKPIISLLFVPTSTEGHTLRLLSISNDRHVAEYDIAGSSITGGMALKSLKRIEQSASPLAASLFPKPASTRSKTVDHEGESERTNTAKKELSSDYFILTANSEFKLKLHNANTQMCRKTVLGPTYGGLLTDIKIVPETEGPPKYLAYATKEKVVGIIKLPLDGNPHRSMGLIAHPCSISNITTTYDGSYLLTAGVEDGAVHMWAMHPNALEAQISIGGKGVEPFLNMLDPSGAGAEGSIYKEMEDYFYYAQLRTQGEDATIARLIQETVELAEVPSIMQAMGFYPSGQEIEDMINEVKFSKVEDGELVDNITFTDLIKLFVNHRPVFDYTEMDILTALVQAVVLEPGRLNDRNVQSRLQGSDAVTKDGLLSLLQQYGETMSKSNFETAFRALLVNNSQYNGVLPDRFSAKDFIENILDLQSVDPNALPALPPQASQPAAIQDKGIVVRPGMPKVAAAASGQALPGVVLSDGGLGSRSSGEREVERAF
ncbi:Cilia- and flagella-associated protein 251 [Phlyctochytrium planicorne]|nr:Cilia- and flagella-associated protein 251 [Phlyctochytrium planicorne]